MKALEIDSRPDPILVHTRDRLLDGIAAAGVSLLMACGGKGLCATCHVHVEQGDDLLTPMTPRERSGLVMIRDRAPGSRLACQAKVLGDGVRIRRPRARYMEASRELEQLIGRRAEEDIRHPLDGRVLIAAGKIITRSRLEELRSVDVEVEVEEMRAAASTIA